MSERMTQERLTWFRLRRREVEAMGLRVDPLVVELHDEVEGAKASEAKKDATIKALADALGDHGKHPDDCGAWLGNGDFDEAACSCGIAAALRLAGCLP